MILWLKALVSLLERWTVSASWDFFLNFLFHTHDLTLFCGIPFATFDIYAGFPWDCILWILEWHLLKIRTNKGKSIVKQSLMVIEKWTIIIEKETCTSCFHKLYLIKIFFALSLYIIDISRVTVRTLFSHNLKFFRKTMHKNLKQIILWPKKALIIKGKLNDFLDKAYICRVYLATAC